jgi:hypothetical protein
MKMSNLEKQVIRLCDKVCQWLAVGQWFSLGTPVSSTNNTDSQKITEILSCFDILNILLVVTVNKLHIVFCQLSYIDYVKIWLHIKCSTCRHPILREIIVFNVKMSFFFGSINQCLSQTKAANSNSVHGEVYPIQCYVIKFVSDLRQDDGFRVYSGFLHQ